MSKVFFDIGLSLDGFMAGENRGPKNPLGDGGPTIHQWMYKQKAWREPQGMEGGEEGPDNSLLENLNSRPSVFIMGKRMFEERDFFADYELSWNPARLRAPVLVVMGRHDYAVPHIL